MKYPEHCKNCSDISNYDVKLAKYEQVLRQIKDIANAVVNGTHFSDNYKDLSEHFQELNKEILRIINNVM